MIEPLDMLRTLFETIKDRQAHSRPGSYTSQLFAAGIDEITKKVGEEAIEVIIAAQHQGNQRLVSELADLAYHCMVLMVQMGVSPADVAAELQRRHKPE
jgi:phosphoribosyl-ATP pyrophosphohydrolase